MRRSPLSNLPTPRQARQGIAVVWLLLTLPVLLILLCLVVEAGNLWLARMELKHAMESAALAAVKEWGEAEGGDTSAARQVGSQFALGNPVRGTSIEWGTTPNYNNNPDDNVNGNAVCSDILLEPETFDENATLVFGAVTIGNQVIFDSTMMPVHDPDEEDESIPYGVRAQTILQIQSVCSAIAGVPIGPFLIRAEATAMFNSHEPNPRLIRVDQFICN